MQKIKDASAFAKVVRGIGVLFVLLLILFFNNLVEFVVNFLKRYISDDNQISTDTVFNIHSGLIFLIIIFTAISVFTFPAVAQKTKGFVKSFIDVDRAKRFLIQDPLCANKYLSLVTLVLATFSGFLIHAALVFLGRPPKEGFIETASSFLFLFSAILLIIAAFRVGQVGFSTKVKKKVRWGIVTFAVVLIYIFGEEISWGQQLFHWESFGIFKDYNFQGETNTHNFLNPLFKYMYPAFGMGSFVILLFLWFLPNKNMPVLRKLFVPHPNLLFLAVITSGASFHARTEVYEELLAIMIFFYCLRLLMCLRSPGKQLRVFSLA